jgi:site-specific DNA recombinase
MKRAVGYVRVSTEEQSREGVSPEMQRVKIRQYAELYDLSLVEIVQDAGISGKTIKARPGIQAVLGMVKARKIDALICYKLDRLARNTIECLAMAQEMDKAGVALHSISEKLDTQSALGRFFFTLTASLAEMERGIISERTAAALAQKRLKGQKTGGDCPFGYQVTADGHLVPDIDEQRSVKRIVQLRGEGFSLRQIVRFLAEEGVRSRSGGTLAKTQIERVLNREAA